MRHKGHDVFIVAEVVDTKRLAHVAVDCQLVHRLAFSLAVGRVFTAPGFVVRPDFDEI
jgi:hypothetical protein